MVQEEIFGPVVTAIPLRDVEEIVPKANDRVYGLAAGVWSRDIKKAHTLASKPRAGTVWINCCNIIFDAALPFRRLQAVRLGPRDGSRGVGSLHGNEGRLRGLVELVASRSTVPIIGPGPVAAPGPLAPALVPGIGANAAIFSAVDAA